MTRLRVVTAAGDPETEARVAASLLDDPEFELVLRCVDRTELLAAIRGGRLDAVITVGLPPWVDAQTVDEARRRSVRLVEVAAPADAERVRRLGIRVVRYDGDLETLCDAVGALDDAPPPARVEAPEQLDGKLIAVWGPKGAPGRSSIALEIASVVAADESQVLLLDGDPYGGDLLQLAGIVEELPTTVWAARMAAKDELDRDVLLAEVRRTHDRGPAMLPGLPRAELWAEISDFGWRRLLAVVRSSFRFTVCDTGFCLEPDASPYPGAGEGRNRVARATVEEADRVVAVCRADPVGVKQFLWGFEDLRAITDVDRVVVVGNRVSPGGENELGDLLRRHVGKRPVAFVPDRPQDSDVRLRTERRCPSLDAEQTCRRRFVSPPPPSVVVLAREGCSRDWPAGDDARRSL